MLHFEVESDRNVTVNAIGLLEAGVPVVVTDEMQKLFEAFNGYKLVNANFPPYVKITAVVSDDPKEDK